MTLETILIWVVIGAVAGWLANAVVGGIRGGLMATILVGIIGAFIGGWLLGQLGVTVGSGLWIPEIFKAFVGAVVFLLILKMVR